MNFKILLYLYILSVSYFMVIILNASDPDENISTYELIKNKGYPVEEHNVTTQDGYILTMHRINKPDSSSSSSKQVVLLQHGLMDSSSTWVVNFANQSLGFILADNNYDVWLGNHRGNRYSQSHIKYSTTQDEYWNFSLDEFAAYDIPAMINYVTRQTNQSKIYYIGHSQGAMVLLARLSRNNDLAEKIKIFVAMGPVAYLGNVIGPIKKVAEFGVHYWYRLFGRKVFLPSNTVTELIADKICGKIGRKFCMEMVNLISGPTINLNVSRLSVYLSHYPAGTSVKNIVHYSQLIVNKNFQMYDYGSEKENNFHYNQTKPPVYDVRKVKLPVGLYCGGADWLADLDDVNLLREKLPNIVEDYSVAEWDHSDLVWASNSSLVYYNRILQLMAKY